MDSKLIGSNIAKCTRLHVKVEKANFADNDFPQKAIMESEKIDGKLRYFTAEVMI